MTEEERQEFIALNRELHGLDLPDNFEELMSEEDREELANLLSGIL